ncbi:hypothetical protein WJX72_012477 [[Myrmecia] bisecta]|uniref:Uncharacterized protein n=1 Tax=[Myrmecia] bisecta TaxID=41462 RepID=A0AAW1QT77_9CHLO
MASRTGKPIVERDKRARENEVAEDDDAEFAENVDKYNAPQVTVSQEGVEVPIPPSQRMGGASAGRTGRSRKGAPIATCDKKEREDQVAMQIYGKPFDELEPSQRIRVGSTVGGERTPEGCYTTTMRALETDPEYGSHQGMVHGAAAATGKPSSQPAGPTKYGAPAQMAEPGHGYTTGRA